MRARLLLLLFAATVSALSCTTSSAQQLAGGPPRAFETASIRPAQMSPGCFSMLPPASTQYAITCMTLRNFIELAYDTTHIEGGGSALDSLYDLRATTPGDKPWTQETVRPMMQQLLATRFHLALHQGKSQLSGFGLIVARNGAKLHSIAPDSVVQGHKAEGAQNFIYAGRVQGRGVDATGIAGLFSAVLHSPVADHTGLTGTFNIDLRYAPDNGSDSSDTSLPSFFTAVEEQLGLKLQAEKVTVDTVVIDHADSEPTPN